MLLINNEDINNFSNIQKNILNILIIILIFFSALIEVKYSIKKINLIKEEYKSNSITKLQNGHFYKHCFDIFIYFTAIIIIINIFIIYIFYISQYLYQHFLKKISITLIYVNYIYFGPILFLGTFFCLKHGNAIFFYYDEILHEYIKLDYINIFFLFLMVSISYPITFAFPAISMYVFFIHSLECKRNGNIFIAHLLCYLGAKYSTRIIPQNLG